MAGLPVTIRLLDPPLHEFLPHDEDDWRRSPRPLGVDARDGPAPASPSCTSPTRCSASAAAGSASCSPRSTRCRRAPSSRPRSRSRTQAAATVVPEIMIPLVRHARELQLIKQRIDAVAAEVGQGAGRRARLPGRHDDRAAARGAARRRDRRARRVLQLRHQRPDPDDAGPVARRFRQVPASLLRAEIFHGDPFQTLDHERRRRAGPDRRRARPRRPGPTSSSASAASTAAIRPRSRFCETVGLDYVSCSPYRVPIARLAAAQAALAGQAGALSGHRPLPALRAGGKAALARALARDRGSAAQTRRRLALLDAAWAEHRAAVVIGLTGPPGVGKSTLASALVRAWRGARRAPSASSRSTRPRAAPAARCSATARGSTSIPRTRACSCARWRRATGWAAWPTCAAAAMVLMRALYDVRAGRDRGRRPVRDRDRRPRRHGGASRPARLRRQPAVHEGRHRRDPRYRAGHQGRPGRASPSGPSATWRVPSASSPAAAGWQPPVLLVSAIDAGRASTATLEAIDRHGAFLPTRPRGVRRRTRRGWSAGCARSRPSQGLAASGTRTGGHGRPQRLSISLAAAGLARAWRRCGRLNDAPA